ncbi:uncharacterized protein LOC124162259 [Ischnura elegans]|uniref:uncharacterized protein LOC124162259 n=1 Tax=Ischnura elegans TaxID=197161 RepID=UPI001ED88EEA|nr:uncharacterized protein LOC124162259 [Ischnura elegans]XP_046394685.1 uncharacterized protein LOC124162259 [Ischnura elegans]XP_046394686.1 uncharacterized protein LOC124162259 [Ischnura elegans]
MNLGRGVNIPWVIVSYALFLTQISGQSALGLNEIYFDYSYIRDGIPRIDKLTSAAQNLSINDDILCTNAEFPQDVSCFVRFYFNDWTEIYLGFQHKSRKNVACATALKRETANTTIKNKFITFTHSFTVCYPDDDRLEDPTDLPIITDRIRNGEIKLILDRRQAKFRMEDVKTFISRYAERFFKTSMKEVFVPTRNIVIKLGNERVMLVSFKRSAERHWASIVGRYDESESNIDLSPCTIDARGRCRG